MSYVVQEYAARDSLTPVPYPTMMDAVKKNRVFMVIPLDDGNFELQECCDNNFGLVISAAQLKALGKELMRIAQGS